jgi:CubicO group peptidase (beta-lactamase class C family)
VVTNVDEIADILDARLPGAMTANGVPGVAIGAVLGEEELIRCFGVEEIGRPTSITGDTLFQVGSVAKSLTGILIQQLVHEDRLSLDVPVVRYVPDLALADADVTSAITCRHLLAHLGGFEGDFFLDTGDEANALARYQAALRDAPQLVPFDWLFSYSNAGYAVLGRVLEVLSDMPYEDLARRLVFEPLGLSRTTFGWEMPQPPVATGHVRYTDVRAVRPWRLFRSYSAWGGLVTTIADFVAYARFFLGHHGAAVLSASDRESLWEPLYPPAKSLMTMGWPPAQRIGALRLLRTGGTAVSQNASLVLAPEHSFALVVITNGDQGGQVATDVAGAVLGAQFGVGEPPNPPAVAVTPERLAKYVGHYRAAIYTLEIGFDADGAWLDAERVGGMDAHQSPRPAPLPRMRLEFVGDDRAFIRGGPFASMPVTFVRDAQRVVRWVRFYGRLTPRVDTVS